MTSGYVAITGKPNVGKSTLLNTLFNRKVAITSPKPQTTRNQIHAIYEKENLKIEFIDTPGWHEPRFKFDKFLNSEIKSSYKIADVVLLLIDLTRPIDAEDEQVIKTIKDYKNEKVILVLTKSDLSSETKSSEYRSKIANQINLVDTVTISSKKGVGLEELLAVIGKHLPNEDKLLTHVDNENFTISEIIREQVIFNTKQELPYATGVYVELNQYDKFTNTLNIQAVIVVEKESQKPIIIGKNGSMIKKIGTIARKELLKIYDATVHLKLFVKVQKEWRNNEKFLSDIGYSNK